MNTKKRNRKRFAILAILTLFLQTVPTQAFTVLGDEPAPEVSIQRISGSNRYRTAIEVSKHGWETSDIVLLARGDDYADALAAGPLASKLGAPLLLTGQDRLHPAVEDELHRLHVKEVVLIGGIGALSSDVEDTLVELGYAVRRIAGANRFETAVRIAEEFGPVDEVFLVSGNPNPAARSFADALSIAPVAGMKEKPILLSRKDALHSSVKNYLEQIASTLETTYIIGGTAVLSEALEAELPGSLRLSGSNRYRTNLAILDHFSALFAQNTWYIATGTDFPDALSGGVLAAKHRAPLILVGPTIIAPTMEYFKANAVPSLLVYILGGATVVSLGNEELIYDTSLQAITLQLAIEKAENAIAVLPDIITLEDAALLQEARALVDAALLLDPNAVIEGMEKLLAAEQAFMQLEEEKALVDAVIARIDALPSIDALTLHDAAALEQARAAFLALEETLQAKVTNLSVLEALELRMEELKADYAAAKAVMDLIDALPNAADVTLTDEPDIQAARNAFEALTEDQKLLVENLPRLLDIEERLDTLLQYKWEANAVDILIADLPAPSELVLGDEAAVIAARTAYEALHVDAKAFVEHLSLLEALESRLIEIKDAMAQAAAVDALIAALPAPSELVLGDEAAVIAARAAYEALHVDAKAFVEHLSLLEALESRLIEIKDAMAQAAAVDALIAALPSVDALVLSDGSALEDARNAYNGLSAEAKSYVTLLGPLEALEARMLEIQADHAATKTVMDLIDALPNASDVTLTDEPDIQAARNAFEALTEDQKLLVENLPRLLGIEERLDTLLQYKWEANAVDILIADLPAPSELVLGDEAAVIAARAAYEALHVDAKAFVEHLSLLEALESRLIEIKDAMAQAAAVDALIDALPSVEALVLSDGSALEDARNAYNGLSAEAKSYVTLLGTLEALEARMLEIQADYAAAKTVMDLIDALPNASDVTLTDEPDIQAVRIAFEALTEDQKLLVENLPRLLDIEGRLHALLQFKSDAEAVDALIAALPAPSALVLGDEAAVAAARAAYEALHVDAKAFVEHLSLLEALESRLIEIKDAMAQAAAVDALIAALPSVDALALSDGSALVDARSAYTALSAEAKSYVTLLGTLEALEARMAVLVEERALADAVINQIAALPALDALLLSDLAAVEAARTAYEALPEGSKPLVSNLSSLEALEGRMALLVQHKSNQDDVDHVKALLEAHPFLMNQGEVSEEADILARIQQEIDTLETRSVAIALEKDSYVPAIAGEEGNPEGIDGTYRFTGVLTKGEGEVLASKTTALLIMTIKATVYVPPSAPEGTLVHSSSENGMVGMLYLRANALYYKGFTADAGWSKEVLVAETTAGRIEMDALGTAHIVYAKEGSIHYVTITGTTLSAPWSILSMNAGTCSRPDLAIDHEGFVHITYTDTRGSDTTYPSIMYAHNKEGAFQRSLIYRGHFTSSSFGNDAAYYQKGSYITVDSAGAYHILTHRHSFISGMGWRDHYYWVLLKSANNNETVLGNRYNTDSFNIYGFTKEDGFHRALYRDNTAILESFGESAETLASTGKIVTGFDQASGFTVAPEGAMIATVTAAQLSIFYKDAPLVIEPTAVAGTQVSVHYLNGVFTVFYTDPATGEIQHMSIDA